MTKFVNTSIVLGTVVGCEERYDPIFQKISSKQHSNLLWTLLIALSQTLAEEVCLRQDVLLAIIRREGLFLTPFICCKH